MRDFQPSELPVGTVIAEKRGFEYIKREGDYWEDLFSGCGCCINPVKVSDAGCPNIYDSESLTDEEKSDDYFTDFRIVAFPKAVLEFILEHYTTGGDEILNAAIASVKAPVED